MSAVSIFTGSARLPGEFELPDAPLGVVIFAHGSGSNRHSPRNQFVAARLRAAGFGTLLVDLLTPAELEQADLRFDFALLTRRLSDVVRFLAAQPEARRLPIGLFGASTGATSSLRVAAAMPEKIRAFVSRGGRPDLAGRQALASLKVPTLFIVGAADHGVVQMNELAATMVRGPCELVLVPHATHLLREPGAIERVAELASAWFTRYLRAPALTRPTAVPL